MSSIQTGPDAEIRVIESAAPPTRFARGWHCLGLAESFRSGKPHSIEAFGTKLVVFADSKGELNVLNGYCPHMGGDLSRGTIKGDEVACPFHDWRWGGDGRCKNIPYAKRVPVRARTRNWITLERNEQLYVWHDPEGNPPPPDVTIPEHRGRDQGRWTPWSWNSLVIKDSHCREIVDNVVDMAHFFYVHFAYPVYFKNVFEGHIAAQYSAAQLRADSDVYPEGAETAEANVAEAIYYGPSYMVDYQSMGDLETVLINCHYPISENSFMLQWGLSVKYPEHLAEDQVERAAAGFMHHVQTGFRQDVEIWKNKTKIDNPLLCDEDGPVYQLRRWYEQFYVDVADVTPDMTQRFEHEIDVERANAVWAKEVEGNLKAGIRISYAPWEDVLA